MKKKITPTPQTTELRRQAEEKLGRRRKAATGSPPATKAEVQRLVHELQVHQIELEMQNEELIQARSELELTLNLYTELYAFAPVGYFTLTREGAIRRANLTGAKLLGVTLSDLVKRHFDFFISPSARTTFRAFLEKVFVSGKKEACEIALQNNGSAVLWVHVEAVIEFPRGEGELCYVIVSDITQRKQAEEELKYLSTHDVLTGLYNHRFFFEEMARVEREQQFPVSIVMGNVDNLKETNDLYGHDAGDELLKRTAQVLLAAFRTEDVVARIAGNEFAVLLPNTDEITVKKLLQRVAHVIQEKDAIHTGAQIRLSLGVSTAGSSTPLSVIFKKADVNMYRQNRAQHDT